MWDVHFAYAFEAWRLKYGRLVQSWLQAVGDLEALGALGAFAYEHPDYPFPEVVAQEPWLEAEQIGHPLLPDATCVRNDVQLGGELRLLVVSGSNMSGKSTLLRTVGINTVLALAGAPVCAARMRVSPMMVGATLRIQDSIQKGDSRFYAEIRKIRTLVAFASLPSPLLFLLDEILHGTNSHDRKIGADAIVRGLLDAGAIGLVTTHDLALAKTADELGITNYRDFLLVGEDLAGKPKRMEFFSLAPKEDAFWLGAATPQKTAKEKGAALCEYLRRVMSHKTALREPKDVAWFLASYARDALDRIAQAKQVPALGTVRSALESALGVEFKAEQGFKFFRSTLVQTLFYTIPSMAP